MGVLGSSGAGRGVAGNTNSSTLAAVDGLNFSTGSGVQGVSNYGTGVYGQSNPGSNQPAVYGNNVGTGYGVRGSSVNNFGVYGSTNYAGGGSAGVYGESLSGPN